MFFSHRKFDSGFARIPRLSWLVVGVALLLLSQGPVRAQVSQEYQLKAVFLTKFAAFVTWPASAFPQSGSPIIIAVVGEDPFGHSLDEAVRGEVVNGRRLEVLRVSRLEEAFMAHIIFIGRSERREMSEILQVLAGSTALTVGETRRFAEDGGMVNFVRAGDRVRFEINPTAAEKAGLTLSSKLLKVGTIVGR